MLSVVNFIKKWNSVVCFLKLICVYFLYCVEVLLSPPRKKLKQGKYITVYHDLLLVTLSY